MVEQWRPECCEDELLVAVVALKRAFPARSKGVDPGTFPVLHHLAASGPSRQGPLADALGLDSSTVSRHVRALVAEGHVDAARDPDDGRATVLTLSEQGAAVLAQRLSEHRATFAAATSDFTTAERTELVRLLTKLTGALHSAEEA